MGFEEALEGMKQGKKAQIVGVEDRIFRTNEDNTQLIVFNGTKDEVIAFINIAFILSEDWEFIEE